MPSQEINHLLRNNYSAGFRTKLATHSLPVGLNKEVIAQISELQGEPSWLLTFRLKAFEHLQKQTIPDWSKLDLPAIDLQKISYFSKPRKVKNNSQIEKSLQKLGVPVSEQKLFSGVAVDVVWDSVSVKTTLEKELKEQGIIFCPISRASREYSDLVKTYLGSVVPFSDNYFASLNSAVFSDGTFVWIPKNTKCPVELSTYFRLNSLLIGQFERTLIVVEDKSSVDYLEGCTAPINKNHQLHSAVVELVAKKQSRINYSTVQNWYSGNSKGRGGILNYVTKRGVCLGEKSQISWTQVEIGSSQTWKYPSVILKGDGSVGEFYSLSVTKNRQQADTGSKMLHIGKNTKSRIVSKSISLGKSLNTFRGLVKITQNSENSENFTSCDSLILSTKSKVFAIPQIEVKNSTAKIRHEATSSILDKKTLLFLKARGLNEEESIKLLVTGNSRDILTRLPLEFVVEAKKLLELTLEDAVG